MAFGIIGIKYLQITAFWNYIWKQWKQLFRMTRTRTMEMKRRRKPANRRPTMACLFRVFSLLVLIVAIGLFELAIRLLSQEDSLGGTIEQAEKAYSLDRFYHRDTPVIQQQRPSSSSGPIRAYYSNARPDRCGGAIQDMLYAHAYSYQQKVEYGGACGTKARTPQHKQMIEMLGLSNELRFACPPVNDSQAYPILEQQVYHLPDTAQWTPDWLDYIRSKVTYPPRRDFEVFQIAVHVRRGDVSLCDKELNFRYLPNGHYLRLIQEYMPSDKHKKVQVTIFSEPDENPLEPWQDFSNYTLELGADIAQVWKTLMMADVVIMSKSSFSIVPAVLNRHGTIVYTPYWSEPLNTWKVVSDFQVQLANMEMVRLQNEKCH